LRHHIPCFRCHPESGIVPANIVIGQHPTDKRQPDGSTKRLPAEGQTIAFKDWNTATAFTACGD
jgi:hypothetical protein